MAYIVMAYIVISYIVMAFLVMAYIVMTYIVMAHIVMAYIVMAHIVMTCIAMAYTVMARVGRKVDLGKGLRKLGITGDKAAVGQTYKAFQEAERPPLPGCRHMAGADTPSAIADADVLSAVPIYTCRRRCRYIHAVGDGDIYMPSAMPIYTCRRRCRYVPAVGEADIYLPSAMPICTCRRGDSATGRGKRRSRRHAPRGIVSFGDERDFRARPDVAASTKAAVQTSLRTKVGGISYAHLLSCAYLQPSAPAAPVMPSAPTVLHLLHLLHLQCL